MDLIKERQDRDGSLQRRHDEWQAQARADAEEFKRELLDKETAVTYAVDHPMMSGREIEIECGFKMSREAIDMARKRKMEGDDDYTLENIIAHKNITCSKTMGKTSSSSAMTWPSDGWPQLT